jgi:uncharacterized protein YggE
MVRIVSVAAAIAALFLAASVAWANEPRVITVTGYGEVAAKPDMATITLGVTNADKEASAAMAVVSANVTRILEALNKAGIAPTDIQTRQLTLNPLWSNQSSVSKNDPEISGFSASNTVMVRIRDVDALGVILDAVVKEGGNRFERLQFGLQDPAPLMDDARRSAVADAMARAALLAEAAGVPLGPVQSISDISGGVQPRMMEAAAARSSGMPIAGGEVTVQANVTMVFAIGE